MKDFESNLNRYVKQPPMEPLKIRMPRRLGKVLFITAGKDGINTDVALNTRAYHGKRKYNVIIVIINN